MDLRSIIGISEKETAGVIMSVEIREVKTSRELKQFVKFPFKLYKNNQYWAPPLIRDELNTFRRDKNPAYDYSKAKYWLAYKDGKIAGRIAGIVNQAVIDKWGEKKARFGWIDFIDDEEVSKALLTTVEKWTVENNLGALEGPMGFTDLDEEGMLIEGFEEQGSYPMIYNYPYYPEHLKKLGYKKEVDWIELEIKVPDSIPEKVTRLNALIQKRSGIHLVDARKPKDFLPYIDDFWEIIDEAYSGLFGTVPLTDKQKELYTKQYFGFIVPAYTNFIVDKNDKLIAAEIALPSLTEALRKAKGRLFPFGFIHMLHALKNPKKLDFYLIGVKKEYLGRGVISIMMNEITKAAMENGIVCCETAGELEDNKAVQDIWKHYEHRQHKRRRCFIKILNENI